MSNERLSVQRRWARFRLLVVAGLLGCPPRRGQLADQIQALAARRWTHPLTGVPLELAFSTIERWYYLVRTAPDPLGTLQRRVRSDAGRPRSITPRAVEEIVKQFQEHPTWSYQLHHDNLAALARRDTPVAPLPSYPTFVRFMRAAGLHKRKRTSRRDTEAAQRAAARLEQREVRSFEVSHVGALWHTDFHACSRQILGRDGAWVTPQLVAVCDDYSRLVCHAQWYLAETAESLVHGLCQAFAKRGLPRALMFDNGRAMKAAEVYQGLKRRSVEPEYTLEYSAYQNGKQEVVWAAVEGRLMAQLESVPAEALTLELLNEATIAYFEFDHNRDWHGETKQRPLDRFLTAPSVLRDCPSSDELRHSFTREATRRQRRSDGTLTVEGVRYELPSAYRHLVSVTVRYAEWDLSRVYLADPRRDTVLCRLLPLDKRAHADKRRKVFVPGGAVGTAPRALPPGIAPQLLEQIERLRATGLPTPYIHKEE